MAVVVLGGGCFLVGEEPLYGCPAGEARLRLSEVPLGPSGFEGAQHRQTLRPSVDGVRSKALRPFGSQ